MKQMERQYSQKTFISSAAAFFVSGLLIGGLLTWAFLSPESPPAVLDVPGQLKEAHLLLDKNQLAEAEKIYLAVIARDPGNPEALSHLGNVAFQHAARVSHHGKAQKVSRSCVGFAARRTVRTRRGRDAAEFHGDGYPAPLW